jgi:lactate permease
MWQQVYDPFGNPALSTIAAAIPVVTLLVLIATGAVRTHIAAIIALIAAILAAVFLFTMPAGLAIRSAILGAITGFFPIGWIVLNVIFMYRLTVATGRFDNLQQAIGGVSADRLRAGDGLFAGADAPRLWRDDPGGQLFPDHDLGDAGDRHLDPVFRD